MLPDTKARCGMVYFLLRLDKAANTSAETLEPPLIPSVALQKANPDASGLNEKHRKKNDEKMQVLTEVKDFNHCTSPVPESAMTSLKPHSLTLGIE